MAVTQDFQGKIKVNSTLNFCLFMWSSHMKDFYSAFCEKALAILCGPHPLSLYGKRSTVKYLCWCSMEEEKYTDLKGWIYDARIFIFWMNFLFNKYF